MCNTLCSVLLVMLALHSPLLQTEINKCGTESFKIILLNAGAIRHGARAIILHIFGPSWRRVGARCSAHRSVLASYELLHIFFSQNEHNSVGFLPAVTSALRQRRIHSRLSVRPVHLLSHTNMGQNEKNAGEAATGNAMSFLFYYNF